MYSHRRLQSADEPASEPSPTASLTMPAWGDLLVVLGIIIMLIIFLRIVSYLSNQWKNAMKRRIDIAIAKRKMNIDNFRYENGYSWDYVIVFRVHKKNDKMSVFQKENSLKILIEKLQSSGLQTKLFYSAQYDEVYCKIRAPIGRLLKEAHRVKYKLLAESTCLSNKLSMGNSKGPIEKHWDPVSIPESSLETTIHPYEFMYIDYNNENPEITNIFKKFENNTVLRGVDRLKLIAGIISARKFNGGCHIDVYRLIKNKCILGFFPLHDIVELRRLEDQWLTFVQAPWNQNVDAVRDYYGEKIAFYFAFLGHYTSWLLSAGIIGFFAWIGVAALGNDPNAPDIPYFAAYIAIWSTLLLEYWKRKEKKYSMMWGTEQFEEEESERPEFVGVPALSPVDGSEIIYFSKLDYYSRVFVSVATISVCISIVVAVIASIFVARITMSISSDTQIASYSSIIASLMNAVQIQVLNAVYGNIAIWLTDYENHRTNTNYENSLIAKTFVFQFVNSFASLFYIAFVKPFIPLLDPCNGSCLKELQVNLGTIFLTRLATGSISSLLTPYIMQKLSSRTQAQGIKLSDLTDVEIQFLQSEYHVVLGTFADYADLMMQFGYATMFISSYPLATLLAFVNNYIEMRIDGLKLTQFSRRPEPRAAENIGTWLSILEIISSMAVLVNAALVCFTGTFAEGHTWAVRVWIFIGMSGGIFLVKYGVSLAVPDTPKDVEVQLRRKAYIMSKIVHNIPDEKDDLLMKNVKTKNIYTIRITDDDPL